MEEVLSRNGTEIATVEYIDSLFCTSTEVETYRQDIINSIGT